jgi:L-seryl-tRNA(Ser) seleniumtransferase
MLFFLNAANPRGQIHHEEFVAIGKKHNVPTMIDAAADLPPVENLWRFTKMGFDLAAFSGGKGLQGPQSAGLLLGRKDLIEAAKLNNNPHADTLCRTNKVNKEEIVGMLVALELFLERDHDAVWKEWTERCRRIAKALEAIQDVQTKIFAPEVANAVPHLRVSWDQKGRGLGPAEMAKRLRDGDPSIEVQPGGGDSLNVAVWMMEPGEDRIVGKRIREILTGA